MKKAVLILLVILFLLLLASNAKMNLTLFSKPTVTESPPYYTYVIQAHPVEDTLHVIIPVPEVSE